MRSLFNVRSILLPVIVALTVGGCWLKGAERDDPCRPVDPGGECFAASDIEAFRTHAEASTSAWPQLDGLDLRAEHVLAVDDLASGRDGWVVPMIAEGVFMAAARFIAVDEIPGQAKLAEIAILIPPRAAFPSPGRGEHLVHYERRGCGDLLEAVCLFRGTDLAIRQADGHYRLADGSIVDSLPD